MPIVYEKKRIPENCATCLYGPNALDYNGHPVGRMGCAHAGRQKDFMFYMMFGAARGRCPSYWLDQNRYERRADEC